MKKITEFVERILSKITIMQSAILLVITTAIFVACIKHLCLANYNISKYIIITLIYFLIFTFLVITALNKTAENLISKKTDECIRILQSTLDTFYTPVIYEPINKSADDEISILCNTYLDRNNFKFYAKLDTKIINVVIKDSSGKVVNEFSTKKYRYFLENFHVSTFV